MQAEARAAHKAKLDVLAVENAARLAEAQEEHAALCARLTVEHEEAGKVSEMKRAGRVMPWD